MKGTFGCLFAVITALIILIYIAVIIVSGQTTMFIYYTAKRLTPMLDLGFLYGASYDRVGRIGQTFALTGKAEGVVTDSGFGYDPFEDLGLYIGEDGYVSGDPSQSGAPMINRAAWARYARELIDRNGGLQRGMHRLPADLRYTRITSYYGERRGSYIHNGIDISMPRGTRLSPFHSGDSVVVTVGNMPNGYGLYVVLAHQTPSGGLTLSLYAHLDNVFVSPGQAVPSGSTFALSGNTGNSTGPHLHYEVIHEIDGRFYNVDPCGEPGISHICNR